MVGFPHWPLTDKNARPRVLSRRRCTQRTGRKPPSFRTLPPVGERGPPSARGVTTATTDLPSPGYVAIMIEMIHDVRIIPLEAVRICHRTFTNARIRRPLGRHTHGVETTNLNRQDSVPRQVSSPAARPQTFPAERQDASHRAFPPRTDPETILYEFTVDDSRDLYEPWTAH